MALEVNDANFKQEVEDYKGVVLVDFWAPWCGPCQTAGPIVEAISTEFNEKAKVVKVNVDENQATAARFSIMSIPTFVFMKDGKEAERKVGLPPQEALKETLDTLLKG